MSVINKVTSYLKDAFKFLFLLDCLKSVRFKADSFDNTHFDLKHTHFIGTLMLYC